MKISIIHVSLTNFAFLGFSRIIYIFGTPPLSILDKKNVQLKIFIWAQDGFHLFFLMIKNSLIFFDLTTIVIFFCKNFKTFNFDEVSLIKFFF